MKKGRRVTIRRERKGYRETVNEYGDCLRGKKTGAEKIYEVYVAARMGTHYECQYVIFVGTGRGYILDIYYPERRLAVELDGGTHSSKEMAVKDKERDELLAKEGIRVVRFKNVDLLRDPDKVFSLTREALMRKPLDVEVAIKAVVAEKMKPQVRLVKRRVNGFEGWRKDEIARFEYVLSKDEG